MAKLSRTSANKLVVYRDFLNSKIYKSKIVSIDEFINNPYYLGNSFAMGKTLFPCWRKALKDVYLSNDKFIVVFTGSTGTGKTMTALVGLAYVMYLHLEMHNIWEFYAMADGGKIAIAFFNLTKTLSMSKGFETLQSFLIKSDYFRQRGTVRGEKIEFPEIDYVLSSPTASGFSSVGHHIIGALVDEIDSPNATGNSQKKIIDGINSTILRLDDRFVKQNKTLGRIFLVTSKQETAGALNTYVESLQKVPKLADRLYIVDIARWDALPQTEYCGKKFKVSCGNAYNLPKIIRDDTDLQVATSKGYKIVDVPIEYHGDFELDTIKALRDIGGIAVDAVNKTRLFPNALVIDNCWDTNRQNPVNIQTIEIGLNDSFSLIDFVDMSKFTVAKNIPRYIHTDISYSEDALGITMACVNGFKEVKKETEDGTYRQMRVPVAHVDLIMRLKARDGDHIPLHKIRRFILDLKDRGFNIAKYTSDLRLAAEDTFQLLNNAGVKAEYFSMDQPITNYIQFRDLVIEGRVNCFPHSILKLELTYLEHDRTGKGKIDHPKQIKDIQYAEDGDAKAVFIEGSKDLADSTSAACLTALGDDTVPMDFDLMKKIMKNTDAKEELVNTMMNVNGQQVIGTVQNGELNKFNEILKGIF